MAVFLIAFGTLSKGNKVTDSFLLSLFRQKKVTDSLV